MKDSGVDWIGKIPEGWTLDRLQWHLDEVKESNDPVKTRQVLSLTNKLGIIPYEDKGEQGNKAKENVTEYKLAYPNTIVANSMNILIGSVGKCNYFGCVSPVYYIFKPKENENIDFLNYIFQSTQFQKELRKYANGILEIRLRVSANDILKREVAFPALNVQNKIVDFLSQKSSEIDALIDMENKQVEKLKEYKQTVITEAVTKGLDKNVPMKDSGVEWIGKIPEGWEVKKLKYFINGLYKGSGITKNEILIDGSIPCIRYGEIYTKYDVSFKQCISKTNLEFVKSGAFFEYGDILFAGTGEIIEEIGKNIVYLGTDKCFAGGDVIIAKHNQNPRFLNYSMCCSASQVQKSCGKSKLKVIHISPFEIGNIYVAIPNVAEQKDIADYLDNKCAEIDSLISLKQKKINLLIDYKKSLIYEYVTGKKEV